MRLPDELQQAIEELAADIDRASRARAARELSARYQAGEFSAPPLSSPAHRVAYLETRMPATYAANRLVFAEIQHLLPEAKFASLLDLAAGPGTSMWAARQTFPGLQQITLVERDTGMVELGKKLAAASLDRPMQTAAWLTANIAGGLQGWTNPAAHDMVVISYGLGELPANIAEKVMAAAWRFARQWLVIIEPGIPRSFQRVLRARQALIELNAQVLAPCPHHQACPLAAANDWCHFAVRLERTAEHRRLKGAALGYEDEKFCYLVASRIPAPWPQARIVRHPLFRPRHLQLTLCTSSGLKQETVSKAQQESYRRARKAQWGDAWGG